MSRRDPKQSVYPGGLDSEGIEAALRRAGERVRREAAAVGGRVVVFKNGKIVWEKPGPEWLSKGERQPRDRRESGPMPIFDLFSKRQKKLRGEVPDVYSYDSIPRPLRFQIVHILKDPLDEYHSASHARQIYEFVVDMLCREYGILDLPVKYSGVTYEKNKINDLFNFLIQESDTERVLDAVELLRFRF